LADSAITLSAQDRTALERVAAELDELPADEPGPRLLHSLAAPIAALLRVPDGPVDDLVLYARSTTANSTA
jgi:hypothetical protein